MSTEHVSVPVTLTLDPEPLLSVDLVCCGPRTIIAIRGEVDLHTVHLITELVEHVARHRPAEVVLDMADVSFFCADGLSALLRARDTVTRAGGHLVLRNPSPKASLILAITDTEHLFPLETTTTAHYRNPTSRHRRRSA
jgi:anti-sigma B factor antagonist